MSGVNTKCDKMSKNASVDMSTSDERQNDTIFKMNDYCFEHLFDWFSLVDLKALRKTCKDMKQLVNNYIERNYSKALRKIIINDVRLERLNGIEPGGFELINHVVFQVDRLNLARMQGVKHILSQAENIEVDCKFPDSDFYEVFLKHCTRMKRLMIRGRSVLALLDHTRSRDWLNQKYPMLEAIGIVNIFMGSTFPIECYQLKDFFEQNPNVRMFSTTLDFICNNQRWMLKSSIKLDRLDIWFCSKTENDFNVAFDILNKLHQREAYQRLHFYNEEEYEEDEFHVITSLPAIELLALLLPEDFWSAQKPLTNLKELILETEPFTEHLLLANSLPNIHRICFTESRIDQVVPFIQGCPQLHQIKIQTFWMDAYADEDGTIDLLALHNVRKKLANACPVAIFVPEYIFMKNKWKQQIKSSLVELKRDHLWRQSNPFFEQHLE